MNDRELERRLENLKRRQYVLIGLLVLPYLLAIAAGVFVWLDAITVFAALLGLLIVAFVVLLVLRYRGG